jgi:hypothetical protein
MIKWYIVSVKESQYSGDIISDYLLWGGTQKIEKMKK